MLTLRRDARKVVWLLTLVMVALLAPVVSLPGAGVASASSRQVPLDLDVPTDAPAIAEQHLDELHGAAGAPSDAKATDGVWFTTDDVPAGDGVLVGADWGGEPAVVAVRARQEHGWTQWRTLHIGAHQASGAEQRDANPNVSDPLWFGQSDTFQVRADRNLDLDLHVVEIDHDGGRGTPASGAEAAPRIRPRSAWGADESLRTGHPVYANRTRFGVVHHEGGTPRWTQSEIDNGCKESPDAIRAIYEYHTQSRGWWDIGYNYIVDPCGTIWEGRAGGVDNPVVGAHTGGFNTGSFGVLALGTFSDSSQDPITSAMVKGIERVFAHRFTLAGISANETVMVRGGGGTSRYAPGTRVRVPRVSAHRITNHTTCPGGHLFSRLFEGDGPSARPKQWFVNHIAARTTPPDLDVRRKAGNNRIRTAVNVSRSSFKQANVAVLVTSKNHEGGIPGAPLAGTVKGPLLMTKPRKVPGGVFRELSRLDVNRVILVGGTGVISRRVANQLRNRNYNVTRLGGKNRYATAARVSNWIRNRTGGKGVLIAVGRRSGSNLPDALTAGAFGANTKRPLLLVEPDKLPSATASALRGVKRVVIFGGTGAVSRDVERQIEQITGPVSKTRFAGSNRYETSAKAMSWLEARSVMDGRQSFMVSGGAGADALSAAAAAGKRHRPMLLVGPNHGYRGSYAHNTLRSWNTRRAILAGGHKGVSFSVEYAIRHDGTIG